MSKKSPFREAEHWIRCPKCGEALGWNTEDGLAGQACSCGYVFKASDARRKACKVRETGPLDMLESLLSITEQFVAGMTPSDRKEWHRISAEVADLRLAADGGEPEDV